MTISGTSSASCADGRPLRHSLVALALLADPVSALLDRGLLKRAFTVAFETGAIDTASTQRLIDCFELWGD
jgi:hypothetical protein